MFQSLIGILQTLPRRSKKMKITKFQSLIGILQTSKKEDRREYGRIVSIPHRYSTN